MLRQHRSSLVRIEVEGRDIDGRVAKPRLGTGVVVGADGLILTAGHVIGRDDDWAETSPGNRLRDRTVRVTGLDDNGVDRPLGNASVWHIPGQDLALLQVNAWGLKEAPLAEQAPPDDASVVALLWEPGGVPEAVTVDLVPTDRARHGGHLTARISVDEGHSGSGLFDAELRLAGVVVSRLDARRALAIPAAWAKRLVDERRHLPARPGFPGVKTPRWASSRDAPLDRAAVLLAALRASAALGSAWRMQAAEVEALASEVGISPDELPPLVAQLSARQPPAVALVWGGGLEVLQPPAPTAGSGPQNVTINAQGAVFGHGAALAGGNAQGGNVTTSADPVDAFGALAAVVAQLAALRPGLQGEAAVAAARAEQALRERPVSNAPAEEWQGWGEQAKGLLARLLRASPQMKALVELGDRVVRTLI
ncbi:MAG: serine protease [Stellaceae bacterium]